MRASSQDLSTQVPLDKAGKSTTLGHIALFAVISVYAVMVVKTAWLGDNVGIATEPGTLSV